VIAQAIRRQEAPPEVVAFVKERIATSGARRSEAIGRAAARLNQ